MRQAASKFRSVEAEIIAQNIQKRRVALSRHGMLGAVHIYAGYLFSRNATLAILLVASMIFRSKGTLNTLILLTAFVQLLDAAVDCMEGRWVIVPGVLIFGLLFLLASVRLSGHPFWRKEA